MEKIEIYNGFWLISDSDAEALAYGLLPKPGYEKLVTHEGRNYWLARGLYRGKLHWTIRLTTWKLVDGTAQLGG